MGIDNPETTKVNHLVESLNPERTEEIMKEFLGFVRGMEEYLKNLKQQIEDIVEVQESVDKNWGGSDEDRQKIIANLEKMKESLKNNFDTANDHTHKLLDFIEQAGQNITPEDTDDR